MAHDCEVMCKGMKILIDAMGIVDAQRFVSLINREKFDYTKWQQDYFDEMSLEAFMKEAQSYEVEHPYEGKAEILE